MSNNRYVNDWDDFLCGPILHPGNYNLIYPLNSASMDIFRIHKDKDLPDGFIFINILRGEPVHEKNGLLRRKYWGLPRYIQFGG